MTPERYVQEFTDPETGEVDGVTFEPLEIWTEAGWEIIPAGFRFSFRTFPAPVRKLLRDEEILLLVLLEWHRTARNTPRWAIERAFRLGLIKWAYKRKVAKKGPFWRFVKDLVRVEVIYFMVRLFGMIQWWYIFRK